MNIAIANGPGRLDNGSDVILYPSRWDSAVPRAPFRFYPYELAYLSTLLKREMPEANVKLLDGNLHGWGADQYAAVIRTLQPDVLICECSALTYATMTRTMQMVSPSMAILCGPMATYTGAHLDGWTHTVVGEYEAKVLALLQGNPAPTGYIDLDWLPWPEDDDIDRGAYYEINHYTPPAVVQVYATRGCPLACTFCVVPSYYGGHGKSHRSHRCRNVDDVCDEIEYLIRIGPAKGWQFTGAFFNDEAHNANPEWFALFCETLIRRGLNRYAYDAMCGMWSFSEELVALAARAGYRQIRFGVESTSEQVGKRIKKTMHMGRIEALLGWLKQYGIGAYGTFQVGAPGSTEATDRQTLADLMRWRDAGLMQKWQVSTSTPQPGTPFYAQAKQEGWLLTEDLSYYNGFYPVLSYPEYPAERIMQVRMMAP